MGLARPGLCSSTGSGTGTRWAKPLHLSRMRYWELLSQASASLADGRGQQASCQQSSRMLHHGMVSCCGEQKRLARSQPDRSAALQTVSGCQNITLIMLCRLCMVSGPHTIAALRGGVKTCYIIHCSPARFDRVSGFNQVLPSYCPHAAMLSGLQGYSLLLPCRRCAVSGSCTIFPATTSLFATLQDGPEPPSGLQCFEA